MLLVVSMVVLSGQISEGEREAERAVEQWLREGINEVTPRPG